jgi:hypothetical protein
MEAILLFRADHYLGGFVQGEAGGQRQVGHILGSGHRRGDLPLFPLLRQAAAQLSHRLYDLGGDAPLHLNSNHSSPRE